MPVHTHRSKWRGIVAAAPLIATGLIALAFVQGEHGIFRLPGVQETLFAIAAVGAVVSAWTAWRLGSASAVCVSQAAPGRVSLRRACAGGAGRRTVGFARWPPLPLVHPQPEDRAWLRRGRQTDDLTRRVRHNEDCLIVKGLKQAGPGSRVAATRPSPFRRTRRVRCSCADQKSARQGPNPRRR